jgi:hypothetical protein
MSTIAIVNKIEDITNQLNDLFLEIEKEKGLKVTNQTNLSWDFTYLKAIKLNEAANRLKVQVKLKTS